MRHNSVLHTELLLCFERSFRKPRKTDYCLKETFPYFRTRDIPHKDKTKGLGIIFVQIMLGMPQNKESLDFACDYPYCWRTLELCTSNPSKYTIQ
jgi:hypothetical protein